MDYSLNNEEVANIAGKQVTMIPYTDIHLYNDLEDLFATNCVLLNYLSKKNYGHWVGLYMDAPSRHRHIDDLGKTTVTFFDSYGRLPDDQLEFIPMKYRIESNQDYPYLVRLIKKWVDEDPRREVHYNDEQFQRYSGKITTCGRWVGFFLRYADSSTVEEFQKNFNDAKDKHFKRNPANSLTKDMFFDRLIVKLTDPYL